MRLRPPRHARPLSRVRYNTIAMIQLTRDQFNARLANGHQLELFDDGKRCRIVGRDEEAELEWFEDYWQRGVLESVGTNLWAVSVKGKARLK